MGVSQNLHQNFVCNCLQAKYQVYVGEKKKLKVFWVKFEFNQSLSPVNPIYY